MAETAPVDRFGTPKGPKTENPLTGSMFLLEYAEVFNPPPTYTYDESGVVIKGMLPSVFLILNHTLEVRWR